MWSIKKSSYNYAAVVPLQKYSDRTHLSTNTVLVYKIIWTKSIIPTFNARYTLPVLVQISGTNILYKLLYFWTPT